MKSIHLIFLLLFALKAFSQPDWQFNSTGEDMTVIIPADAIDSSNGLIIGEGDYIAVFYTDDNSNYKCGGYIEWHEANDALTAYGNNSFSSEKDGFSNLENLIWKIWDASENRICHDVIVEYNPTHSGQYSIDDVAFIGSFSIKLSVELTQFNGALQENQIFLNWETQSETNHDFFQVERSSDGFNYYPLGAKIQGKGTPLSTQEYAFIDEKPMKRNNYYRLKIQDTYGVVTYSDIVNVYRDIKHDWEIFPSPLMNQRYITLEFKRNLMKTDFEINISNTTGTVVYVKRIYEEGFQEGRLSLYLPELPNGVYFFGIKDQDNFESRPILILN